MIGLDLDDRLGVSALARLFGISRYSMAERVESASFPPPCQVTNGRRLWRLGDVVEYCRARCEQYDERPEVRALAELGR